MNPTADPPRPGRPRGRAPHTGDTVPTSPPAAITPRAAISACTRAAEHLAADAAWGTALQHTARSLIDRLAESQGLPPTGLDYPHNPAASDALDALGPLTAWHILDIGEIHQRLLELTPTHNPDGTVSANRANLGKRAEQGAWYTPADAARAMCRLSIGPQLDRLERHPDPWTMLQVLAIDPACGAGVFLVEAARLIARRFALRLLGAGSEAAVKVVLPTVLQECVFGVDIDPVAVDLAKAALWMETGGRAAYSDMDRNVIVGNALDDEMPPAFRERRGEPVPPATRRAAVA